MKITKKATARGDRYQVRWRTRDGVQRARTFTTKKEAESWRSQVQRDLDRGLPADPRPARMRFDAWADKWRATYLVGRPTTVDRDASILRTHVVPEFGAYRLGDIRKGQVQAWVNALASTGITGRGHGRPLSPATVHKCHQVLAKVLDAAVADELVPSNAARDVRLPSADHDERRFMTEDEVIALEDAMPTVADRLLVAFLADSGLRIGEAAALRWDDLDLAAGTVFVRATAGEARGGVVVNAPKTRKGRRRVPTLTDAIVARLAAHRDGAPGDALVFPSPKGAHLRTRHYRARVWHPAVERAGLAEPLPTPHSLRHTAVSRWIAAGVEPHQVAEFAGHSSIATVFAIYGHLLEVDVSGPRAIMAARRADAEARRGDGAKVLRLAR